MNTGGRAINSVRFRTVLIAAAFATACRDPGTGVPDPIAALTFLPAAGFAPKWVGVPPAVTALRVTLSGGTGDPDLYLYRPGNVEVDSEDCSSFTDGPIETCVVPNPASGVWWVRVDPFIAHAGTTILATLAPAPM